MELYLSLKTYFSLLILLIVSGFILIYPKYDGDKESNSKKIGWENLCKTIDCSELPSGYITIDTTGYRLSDVYEDGANYQSFEGKKLKRFYLPIIHNGAGEIIKYGTRLKGGYEKFQIYENFEYDQFGRIIRGFNAKPRYFTITSSQNISLLLKHYSLFEKWKEEADYNTKFSIRIFNASDASINQGPPISFGYSTLKSDEGDKYWYKKNDLLNFNNDFFLYKYTSRYEKENGYIEYSGSYNGKRVTRRGITLVSKKPILFGRYVFLHCYLDCTIHSIVNDKTDTRPVITVVFSGQAAFDAFPHFRVNCDKPEPQPLFECDNGLKSYDNVPAALKIIEELVQKLMKKPENRRVNQ